MPCPCRPPCPPPCRSCCRWVTSSGPPSAATWPNPPGKLLQHCTWLSRLALFQLEQQVDSPSTSTASLAWARSVHPFAHACHVVLQPLRPSRHQAPAGGLRPGGPLPFECGYDQALSQTRSTGPPCPPDAQPPERWLRCGDAQLRLNAQCLAFWNFEQQIPGFTHHCLLATCFPSIMPHSNHNWRVYFVVSTKCKFCPCCEWNPTQYHLSPITAC